MCPDFKNLFLSILSTSFHLCYAAFFMHFHPSSSLFIFFVMLSFIWLVPLCSSLLKRIAVCNTAHLKLCWCTLLICNSESSCSLHIPPVLWFLLRRLLLTASGHSCSIFSVFISDLRLAFCDAVHGRIAVSSFSYLVFTVLLEARQKFQKCIEVLVLSMIHLLHFYTSHFILCPKLMSIS